MGVIWFADQRLGRPRSLDYRTLALVAAPPSGGGLESSRGPSARLGTGYPSRGARPRRLEASEAPAAGPYHAMRVHAEISGPWLGVLRHLLGKSPADLRDLPLWLDR